MRIELYDAVCKWGEYNHSERTIFLSRKLIQNFSWAHTIGVLKHEMAHQIVYESNAANVLPHGKEFKQACEQILVPPLFASAAVELIDENPDFELTSSSTEQNHLIEKVKKLMSLATSNNEHEANLATAKVHELYLKYNLEKIGLNKNSEFDHLIIETNKKRLSVFEKKIISILVDFYFVKAIVIQQFNPKTLEHNQAIELMGLRENIQMAEYVYHFLLRSCDQIAKQAQQKLSKVERDSLKIGLLDGFDLKLKNETQIQIEKTNCKSLLVISDQKLDYYLHQYYPRLRSLKSSSRSLNTDQYSQGVSAGQKMNLNKPITRSSINEGFLGFTK